MGLLKEAVALMTIRRVAILYAQIFAAALVPWWLFGGWR